MTDPYYTLERASASGLRLIKQSPAHYRWHMDNPTEPTPAMQFGTRAHCAILEPEQFDNRYTRIPEGLDRRTKEGKALWESIVATGKEPVKYDDVDAMLAMRAAALSHPISRVIFELPGRLFETPIMWADEDTGVACKMRPDLHVKPCDTFPRGLILDVKTTTDASPEGFAKNVWNMEMELQAAMYPDGFRAEYGETPDFLWLAIEKEQPYACAYYAAPERFISYGRREYKKLLNIYRSCIESGKWPAYSEQVTELVLPKWAENVMEASV